MLKKLFGFGKNKEEKIEKNEEIEENIEKAEESVQELDEEHDAQHLQDESLAQETEEKEQIEQIEQIEQGQAGDFSVENTEGECSKETLKDVLIENVVESVVIDEHRSDEQNDTKHTEEIEFADSLENAIEANKQDLNDSSEETTESRTDVMDFPIQTGMQESNIQEEELQEVEKQPQGFFGKLKQGLNKTSQNFSKKINELFSGYQKIDDSIYEELEELLVLADLGFETAIGITETLRERAEEKRIEQVSELQTELEDIIEEILLSATDGTEVEETFPQIIVVVGVNGVGKTTSIGKIASQFKKENKTVMLAAGDTFRAAASDQLSIWATRADVPIVRSNEGADPSAVIFDAIKSAQAKNIDVLICDTAGRLHNKANLMQELEKIFRIVNREYPEAKKEVFLVIDATTGQNAMNQAKTFSEVAPLTGIVLTKLDGTAKGGVVIGLSRELKIPIRYVGVGEGIDDLQRFSAKDFAKALFVRGDE